MNKKLVIKKVIFIIVAIVLMGGIIFARSNLSINKPLKSSTEDVKSINIVVVVEGNEKRLEVKEGLSVMDIMKENYDVKTEFEDTFIVGIDNVVADEDHFIEFNINNEMAMVGACDYVPSNEDVIEFKLTEIIKQ